VFIKELRQQFHGKLFLITMALLLLAQLATVFILYANMETAKYHNSTPSAMGPNLFAASLITFGIACVLLCAISSLQRFMQERINPELDFSRFCAMTPLQILWGKMTSCYAIAIYLLSLCLPFLVIAYFLRGLSIIQIALGVAYAIIGTLFAIQVALFIGSIGQKSLTGLLVFLALWGSGGLASLIAALVSSFNYRYNANLAMLFSLSLFLAFVAIGFIFVLNLALLSSPFANRTMPARIYTIAITLISPAFGYCICLIPKSPMPLMENIVTTFFVACVISSCLCSFIAAFERSIIGPRVQHQCPQQPLKRLGFFLISSGSGGGITLAWIFQLIALAIVLCLFPAHGSGYSDWPISDVDAFVILTFGFASLLYTEIGLCVHKRLKIAPFSAWLTSTVIIVFIPMLLYAFATFTYSGNGDKFIHLLIATPFYLISLPDDNSLKLTDIVCWIEPFFALLALGFALPYIIEQYKSLRIPKNS
ncbi:MAG: hypothetical protein IKS92_09385, partial [Victivallales bacterium]|nr:hypothetical protein [Victivallales bacterium]